MEDAQQWREQAAAWRSLADVGEDALLHEQLHLLADEAEAMAAEIDAET